MNELKLVRVAKMNRNCLRLAALYNLALFMKSILNCLHLILGGTAFIRHYCLVDEEEEVFEILV
ncbi:hypothetical protein TSUD_149930 [Trifolium subterraneum]|uniref:Uncharacterized protein n=1 Tax=Trifolium subterraneum TaxID=3900 RepID=A0A2Z6MHW3_TRISU|nr:hypothetical protein TSUD_149930 [Trifolium subterraneum]